MSTKLRRILSVVLALSLVFSLGGISYAEEPADPNDPNTPPQPPVDPQPSTEYNITVNTADLNGVASADKATCAPGGTVTITAGAHSGFVFSSWSGDGVTFADASAAVTTFVMPEGDVTVTASFVAQTPTNTITAAVCTGGTVSADKATANKDDQVVITATPDPGYFFTAWAISGNGGTYIPDGTSARTYLTMPDDNITISAIFTPATPSNYTITIYADKGVDVECSYLYCPAGHTVSLNAILDEYYAFDNWTSDGNSVTFSDDTDENVTFSMPAQDVVIYANAHYDPNLYHTLTLYTDGGGVVEPIGNKYTYATGEEVKIIATPIAGYVFYAWGSLSDGVAFLNENNYQTSFIMPAWDVTVKGLFMPTLIQDDGTESAPPAPQNPQTPANFIVSFNTNGGSFIDSQTVNAGDTASRPMLDPELSGYTFAGWYSDASCTTQYNFASPVYMHTTVYAKWINTSSGKLFDDVSTNDWFYDYVAALSAKGIVGGMGNNTFKPNANITRAQFVKMLACMAGVNVMTYGSSGFNDVDDTQWYAPYISWAKTMGIAGGSGGNFKPNANITRQDMAVMLKRYADAMYISLSAGGNLSFADSDKIASYAIEAVSSMQAAGVIGGKGGNLFDPIANATRGEACKMLYIMMGK